ncbi:UNVERIFIED_CONTAM: hypothetical protein FKN15_062406 [Acipenser sinensis]
MCRKNRRVHPQPAEDSPIQTSCSLPVSGLISAAKENQSEITTVLKELEEPKGVESLQERDQEGGHQTLMKTADKMSPLQAVAVKFVDETIQNAIVKFQKDPWKGKPYQKPLSPSLGTKRPGKHERVQSADSSLWMCRKHRRVHPQPAEDSPIQTSCSLPVSGLISAAKENQSEITTTVLKELEEPKGVESLQERDEEGGHQTLMKTADKMSPLRAVAVKFVDETIQKAIVKFQKDPWKGKPYQKPLSPSLGTKRPGKHERVQSADSSLWMCRKNRRVHPQPAEDSPIQTSCSLPASGLISAAEENQSKITTTVLKVLEEPKGVESLQEQDQEGKHQTLMMRTADEISPLLRAAAVKFADETIQKAIVEFQKDPWKGKPYQNPLSPSQGTGEISPTGSARITSKRPGKRERVQSADSSLWMCRKHRRVHPQPAEDSPIQTSCSLPVSGLISAAKENQSEITTVLKELEEPKGVESLQERDQEGGHQTLMKTADKMSPLRAVAVKFVDETIQKAIVKFQKDPWKGKPYQNPLSPSLGTKRPGKHERVQSADSSLWMCRKNRRVHPQPAEDSPIQTSCSLPASGLISAAKENQSEITTVLKELEEPKGVESLQGRDQKGGQHTLEQPKGVESLQERDQGVEVSAVQPVKEQQLAGEKGKGFGWFRRFWKKKPTEEKKISKAATELMLYCQENHRRDPLLSGVPASANPFKDKKTCVLL